jgi:hypothetical protein
MKTLFLILFSFSAFGASELPKYKSELSKPGRSWILGFYVAEAHFQDIEMTEYDMTKECQWERFEANKDLGEFKYSQPKGYKKKVFYSEHGLSKLFYKCVGPSKVAKE